ncbi:hypothetical protein [Legionella sp. W05-934-2]|uniref:hypothetical protein n=1 Tax=Legionella sp. W05-934-2 TaxID=1198649 RepID=UPI0034636B54
MKLQRLNDCEKGIKTLPPGEIQYYLHLAILTAKERHQDVSEEFIHDLADFITKLNRFYDNTEDTNLNTLDDVLTSYRALQSSSKTNSYGYLIQTYLLQIGSLFTATLFGILGTQLGGFCGLIRGLWNFNPISGTLLGMMAGFYIGAAFGFRTPKKLLKDPLLRQTKYALDGIGVAIKELQESITIADYIKDQETLLIANHFDNDPEKYAEFLEEDITFEIRSYKASFIAASALYGYVGQHAYIRIPIKQEECLIEFSPTPSDTSDPLDQCEARTVKGKVIVEMLALHNKLIKTHSGDLSFALHKMKPGEVDCVSYLNKILLGTHQKAAQISRFYDMNIVGRAIGFFSDYLSPFRESFLQKALDEDPMSSPSQ